MKTRIQIVDALRGFSLAGIVLVHFVERFIGSPSPPEVLASLQSGIPNGIVNGFIFLILRGKFFALFSFLFGLSFFIQMDNASQRGDAYQGRFIWRMVLLFIIGFLHHLFYRGDILTIYALLAIPLIPFFNLSNRVIWVIIIFLFLGLPKLMIQQLVGGGSLFNAGFMDPESVAVFNYWNTLTTGNWSDVAYLNAGSGFLAKLDFQFTVFGRGYLTFAFFLMGLWIGRINYFRDLIAHRTRTRNLIFISLGGFLVSGILTGLFFNKSGNPPDFGNVFGILGLTFYDLANLFTTIIIIGVFVLVYIRKWGEKLLGHFTAYGRMALSNYVFQSIFGTFLLYNWGVGFITKWQDYELFLIGILVIFIQIMISKWWLKIYYYGPLEWLWRCGTKLERVALKRK